MKIANYEIGRYEISIALMILFTMVVMFFLGYGAAYNKAVDHANHQIKQIISEYKRDANIINVMPSLYNVTLEVS